MGQAFGAGVKIEDFSVENILFPSLSLTKEGGLKYSKDDLVLKQGRLEDDLGFGNLGLGFGTKKGKKGKKAKGVGGLSFKF